MDDATMMMTYGNTALLTGTKDRPLVTFALFAYNQEKFIREAVESAFAQNYSPLEIILSDDCSSDRTFEIIEEMARDYRGPHKLVVRRNTQNSGIFQHFMCVFKIASGAITVVAAGDDCSRSQRTSEVVKALNNNPAFAAACSSVEKIDEGGSSLGLYSPPLTERIGFVCGSMDHILGCSAAYITKFVIEVPDLFLDDIAEDAFLSHVLQLQGFRIFRIKDPLVKYRIAKNNLSIIESGGWGYSDYLRMEDRKNRRLLLNYNTYLSIEKYDHLIKADSRKRLLNRNLLLHHVKKLASMLRAYRVGAVFDLDFLLTVTSDFESLKFVLPRIFGTRVSYLLFLMRETIRNIRAIAFG